MTPNSGSFGTIKLPGTDMSIPMGGPIRGIVQAVTPQMKEIKGLASLYHLPGYIGSL